MRDNQLILGKEAIRNMYPSLDKDDKVTLTWIPEFVDVSKSGDMAYTYGEYIYSIIGIDGNIQHDKGVFHTVWKRQSNGEWRFVWD